MGIPIFVSCPSDLNKEQQASKELIFKELISIGLDPRSLGRSDYPLYTPLREVLMLARRCSGGLILGYSQIVIESAIVKPGTPSQRGIQNFKTPTPWNQLEAGILFALGLPLLIFSEPGIFGGVFDLGSTDLFIHKMPSASQPDSEGDLREILLKWSGRVREHYERL